MNGTKRGKRMFSFILKNKYACQVRVRRIFKYIYGIYQKRTNNQELSTIRRRKKTLRPWSIASILSASDCGSNSSPISFISRRGSFWIEKRPVTPWIFWELLVISWSWNRNAELGFRRTLTALPAKRIDSPMRIWIYSGSISCTIITKKNKGERN